MVLELLQELLILPIPIQQLYLALLYLIQNQLLNILMCNFDAVDCGDHPFETQALCHLLHPVVEAGDNGVLYLEGGKEGFLEF